jgi:NADH dehydrogenase/NADH:ubiquinone oxidoreductase subunit G
VSWLETVQRIAEALSSQRPHVVASAGLSNEALYLVHRILASHLGLDVVVPVDTGAERSIKNGRNEWVRSRDAHPNSTGARSLGLKLVDGRQLGRFVASGPMVVLDAAAHPQLATAKTAKALAGRVVAAFGASHTPVTRIADLVVPTASWFECEGTMTSSTGRVQVVQAGRPPGGLSRPAWRILVDVGVALGLPLDHLDSPRAVFEDMAAEIPAFAGMAYRRLAKEPGVPILEEVSHVG